MSQIDDTGSTAGAQPVGLLEGLATTRSIRRYLDQPIPERDLATILWSATRAPSGTNRQPFRFLVLRAGERAGAAKALLGEAFRRGWTEKMADEGWRPPAHGRGRTRERRMLHAMQQFVDRFEAIPVVVLACFVRYRPLTHAEGASIFPACQNLLLAARALGYGGCFSGWHVLVERELRELLEIPDKVEISLTITLGRPAGRHGPVRRRPISELVFEERWGEAAPWAEDPPGTRFTRGGPPA
ncbi:MAG TPA: nitroreductase family protein [Thermoanaerobaculia bacterium]|nr:nitroreductase family protein [Thermoanaerobaculia bacterium]